MASIDWAGQISLYLGVKPAVGATIPALQQADEAARGKILKALGGACQAAVERWISRTFELREWTEKYNGNGRSSLYLRHDPIVSVASLSVYGVDVAVDDPLAPIYPPGRVVVNPAAAGLEYTDGSVFPCGMANVLITYTAGLAVPDPDGGDASVPEDLVQATAYWGSLLFKDRHRVGLSSETVQEQTTGFVKELPKQIQQMVGRYRRGYLP